MSATPSAIAYLFGLEQFGIKLGLDNIRSVCEALEHPERDFPSLIVAGTNGKGSVAAMLETALRSAGYATGRFTSPHLTRVEERFVIDGHPVSEAALEYEADRLRTTVRQLQDTGRLGSPPTFFEATTAIALSLFRHARVQVAILEVGMGGRFDATNVVTPVAAGITSIDLDHQQYLGPTLERIAFEKAGVIKPGMVVVVGETKPPVRRVLQDACRERDAEFVASMDATTTHVTMRNGWTVLELTTPIRHYGPVLMALRGRHQVRNATVAVRLLEKLHKCELPVPEAAIVEALAGTRWPGRLDLVRVDQRRSLLMDAAHNVAAATALAEYLREAHPAGVHLVFAALRDKDVRGMVEALRDIVTHVTCVPLKTHRAHDSNELAAIVRGVDPALPVRVAESPRAGVDIAWQQGALACAAGSVFLVGELIEELRRDDPTRALAGLPG